MGKGYIYLNRSIEDNWIWKQRPFSKGQAWIDLLLLANHADGKHPKGDHIQSYKKGCVYRSIYFLAERWGWDRKTVKRFLNVLQDDQMVSVSCSPVGTTITIVNYGKYQDKRPTDGTTHGPTDGTTHGTQTNNNQYITKHNQARARDEAWEGFVAEMKRRGEWTEEDEKRAGSRI